MKYLVTLRQTIEKTVVIDAPTDEGAQDLLESGRWEFETDRVTSRDEYHGFELRGCERTNSTVITCEDDLKKALGTEDVERYVYKYTDCGCCYRAEPDFIGVAGYAEGTDAECPENRMYFPFTIEDWERELAEADREGCELWDECHGDGAAGAWDIF